jgi:hypothetical protein
MPKFKSLAEMQAYIAANDPNYGQPPAQRAMPMAKPVKEQGFLESLVGGIVNPFIGLGKKTLEGTNAALDNQFGDFLSQNGKYQNKFLNAEEAKRFKDNAFLDTAQDVAGVASNFVPVGKAAGLLGLAKAGAISGGLSSFANQKDGVDINKIGADALLGGAIGGGVGVGSKLLSGARKAQPLLDEAGTAIKASSLGYKPTSFADDTAKQVVKQLDAVGMSVTGRNAEKLANNNTDVFKESLKGAAPIDLTATAKELTPAQIKKALQSNPDMADLADGIQSYEDILAQMNTRGLGRSMGTARNMANSANIDNMKGLDVLASQLDEIVPGYNFSDMKPDQAVEEFWKVKDKMTADLDNVYKAAGQALKPKGDILDNVLNNLESKQQIGANVLDQSPMVKASIQDQIDSILKTKGSPAEIMDKIGSLTLPKNVLANDLSLSQQNKVIEGVRQTLRDTLTEQVPGADQYYKTNAPLRRVNEDALKASQKADRVTVPFAGVSMDVPGVGAAKEQAANSIGGFLQNLGKGASNLDSLLSKVPKGVNAGNITKFGSIYNASKEDAPAVDLGQEAMAQQEQMSQAPQAAAPQQMTKEQIAQYNQLLMPVKQGGMGMTPAAARDYLETVGVLAPKAAAKKPPGISTIKQKAQVKAGQRGVEAIDKIIKVDKSVLQKSLLPEFLQDANTRSFKNQLNMAVENYGRLQTGAAIGSKEMDNFKTQFYSEFATPAAQAEKLQLLREFFNDADPTNY